MAVITGNNLRNKLTGKSGADTISGLGGNDVLLGLGGNDTMRGGSGNDTMDGGSGNDKLFGDTGNDTLKGGLGNDALDGGRGDDTLSDTDGTNTFTGGLGNDRMTGGTGDDTFIAGPGADLITGGANLVLDGLLFQNAGITRGDWLSYADSTTAVTVYLDRSILPSRGAAGDTWTGIENLQGSQLNDILVADSSVSAPDQFIFGGAGNDIINGGTSAGTSVFMRGDAGTDYLFGHAGADNFILQYGQGMDWISGIDNPFGDSLLVSKSEFNLAGAVGVMSAGTDLISAADPFFTNSTDRLLFETDTHILWADKDGSGDAFFAEPIAVLQDSSGGLASVNAGFFGIIA